MSRMTYPDWAVYAVLRNIKGKAYAEEYRHRRNKKNAQYGIGLHTKDARILVKDFGIDGILVKEFIPGKLSDADILAIEDSQRIEINSPYDCTGRPFTAWIQFFKTPNGYWMYHRISYDV